MYGLCRNQKRIYVPHKHTPFLKKQFPFPSLAKYTELHLKGNIHSPYLQNRIQYSYHATIDPPIAHVCQAAIVKKFGSCREFRVLPT